jgi:hypothetical protein
MIRRAMFAIAIAVILAGCTSEGIAGITVVTSGRHVIAEGTRAIGSVAVGGGSLTIEGGGAVDGDVYVGDGEVLIAGSVGGDLSAIGGVVRLQPSARVAGTVRVGAGADVTRAPGSTVVGGVQQGLALPEGGDGGSTSPAEDAAWAIGRALVLVLVAAAIRQLAPRRVAATRRHLTGMTAASASYGFLVALVGLSLIVFMAFTIVLIPVALIGLVGLALGTAIGMAAALDAFADRLGGLGGASLLAALAVVLPAIPLVGMLGLLLGLLTSLGAATLSFQRPWIATVPSSR